MYDITYPLTQSQILIYISYFMGQLEARYNMVLDMATAIGSQFWFGVAMRYWVTNFGLVLGFLLGLKFWFVRYGKIDVTYFHSRLDV